MTHSSSTRRPRRRQRGCARAPARQRQLIVGAAAQPRLLGAGGGHCPTASSWCRSRCSGIARETVLNRGLSLREIELDHYQWTRDVRADFAEKAIAHSVRVQDCRRRIHDSDMWPPSRCRLEVCEDDAGTVSATWLHRLGQPVHVWLVAREPGHAESAVKRQIHFDHKELVSAAETIKLVRHHDRTSRHSPGHAVSELRSDFAGTSSYSHTKREICQRGGVNKDTAHAGVGKMSQWAACVDDMEQTAINLESPHEVVALTRAQSTAGIGGESATGRPKPPS